MQGVVKQIKERRRYDKQERVDCRPRGTDDDCCCAVVRRLGSRQGERAAADAAKNVEIKIDNFSFAPGAVTVVVGTTVAWINHDDIPHTAVSTDGVFKSKVMDTDEKFSYTFTKAGTYPYLCSIHPKMTGTIVAQ